MMSQRTCTGCRSPIAADAPRGLCPACLMRAAQALSPAGTGAGATLTLPGTGAAARPPAGAMAALAETIGSVPRVLLRDTEGDSAPEPVVQPSSAEMPGLPDHAPRLHLLGEIARGGMGAVLKGRDVDLGRDLAVKVLLEKHRDHPELIRRFVEEAQIGGQLQHPGIVPIYELGAFADRRPYFSMKLVKGRTLAALLADRPDPAHDLPRLLSVFEQICQTVAYAHARGVIHRDLKPSNVMVGSFGEVQVMDWGLAKVLPRGGVEDDRTAGKVGPPETLVATARSGTDSDLSQAGSVMGTPAYMPPEQARGEIDQVDERADVFALGSILCEILTGSPAFLGRTPGEIQRKAALGDVADALARLDASGADAELVLLARSCLAPEPEDRPRDAGLISDRLTAYLAGVQNRLREAELDRARAEARAAEERKRRRLQVGLALAVLALAGLGGAAYTVDSRRRHALETRIELALNDARLLREQARQDPDDPTRWQAAAEAIKGAGLVLGESGLDAPRGRLAALDAEIRAGLEAATRDAEMLRALDDARSAHDAGFETYDTLYTAAFVRGGLDLDSIGVEETAARLRRRSPDRIVVIASLLDEWATVRRDAGRPEEVWHLPLEVTRIADPDPFRNRIRDLLRSDDPAKLDAFRALARSPEASTLPPPTAYLLADSLYTLGDPATVIEFLELAVARHPGDYWLAVYLALILNNSEPPRDEEALRYYTAARALQPESSHQMAHLLAKLGRNAEAEAVWSDLARRRPDQAQHHLCFAAFLGGLDRPDADADAARAVEPVQRLLRDDPEQRTAPTFAALIATLKAIDRPEDAASAFQDALRHAGDDPDALHELGHAFKQQDAFPEAADAFTRSVRLRPEAHVWVDVASARYRLDDLPGMVAACREAVALAPDSAAGHQNLGNALSHLGQTDEAIEALRTAVRLAPDSALAHEHLGDVLYGANDTAGAADSYREAIRLDPSSASSHYGLGLTLLLRHAPDEAEAALREAIRLQPDHALAHCYLAGALEAQGDLDGAIAMMRAGHALGSKQPDWRNPSGEWIARLELLRARSDRLPDLLSGEEAPDGPREAAILATHALYRSRFAAAARLSALALRADADDPAGIARYNAACAAALAWGGQGEDAPPPDDPARDELQRLARSWLLADLASLKEQLTNDPQAARSTLRSWTNDPDLASVRDEAALLNLPEEDRAAWQSLWDEVDRLLSTPDPSP